MTCTKLQPKVKISYNKSSLTNYGYFDYLNIWGQPVQQQIQNVRINIFFDRSIFKLGL